MSMGEKADKERFGTKKTREKVDVMIGKEGKKKERNFFKSIADIAFEFTFHLSFPYPGLC